MTRAVLSSPKPGPIGKILIQRGGRPGLLGDFGGAPSPGPTGLP
jgi:hypothetical protein